MRIFKSYRYICLPGRLDCSHDSQILAVPALGGDLEDHDDHGLS